MLNELFANHGSSIFIGILLCLVILLVLSASRKKSRQERPDSPPIFGPIRGMYVCYACDTIFNTARCPTCAEEAVIPLVQLTGTIAEDDRIAVVISKLREPGPYRLPALRDIKTIAPAPALMPEPTNGSASQDPAALSALRAWTHPE
jgi:hypothetical protein